MDLISININWLEISGLIFGLLCVWLLIKENIWNWPAGIIYTLISLFIFYQEKLYADLGLHVIFLIMNIYGWYFWAFGKKKIRKNDDLPVTTSSSKLLLLLTALSGICIFIAGFLLKNYTDASLPYWDTTTSILSLSAMYLTARKKIESWYFWLVVDMIASGIYLYKEIYFYCALYLIYIILAVVGYLSWRKSLKHFVTG